MTQWENVYKQRGSEFFAVKRFPVPGGWIYFIRDETRTESDTTAVFVPSPTSEEPQA